MKYSATLIAFALFASAALATDRPQNPPAGPSTSTASSSATASATAQNAATSNANGGNVSTPNSWAVALPGHASPSYAGNYSICVQGRGIGWNLFWTWAPDLDCVRLIADLDKLARTPIPPSKVELLTEYPAAPVVASCATPAKAKTVAAAKSAGACKS